jgi:hypothetical protein
MLHHVHSTATCRTVLRRRRTDQAAVLTAVSLWTARRQQVRTIACERSKRTPSQVAHAQENAARTVARATSHPGALCAGEARTPGSLVACIAYPNQRHKAHVRLHAGRNRHRRWGAVGAPDSIEHTFVLSCKIRLQGGVRLRATLGRRPTSIQAINRNRARQRISNASRVVLDIGYSRRIGRLVLLRSCRARQTRQTANRQHVRRLRCNSRLNRRQLTDGGTDGR